MPTLRRHANDATLAPAKSRKLTTRQLLDAGLSESAWRGMEELENRVLMSVSGTNDLNDAISEIKATNIFAVTTAGRTTVSSLAQKDVDMFGFTVTAGQRVAFNINTTSGLDSYLRLFNAGGTQLAFNDNGAAPGETLGKDAYLEYTFTSAGTYYIGLSAAGNIAYNASNGNGDTTTATTGAYTFNFKDVTPAPAPTPTPPPDNAGNSLAAARNLGTASGTQSYSDYVNSTDTDDFYKFVLGANSNVTLSLTGLGADAALQLIKDANNNGVIDSGDVLATSNNSGTNNESISSTLTAGTYFARVYRVSGDTSYTLTTNVTAVPPPDNAGNTLAAARNLGTASGTQSYSDYVNSSDTDDFYKFALGADSNVTLSLTGLGTDAALQLIKDANNNGFIDSGDVLATSNNSGTNSESISSTLTAGTYFARVYRVSGDTGYTLTTNVTAVPAPAPTPTPTNWFTTNLKDAALASLSSSLGIDGNLNRTDMITILRSAGNDGTVNATELADLRLLVSNATTLGMADYVRVLASNVVNASVANAKYLGAALGNLAAGSTATQLNNLVDKWFLGTDRPVATPYGGGTAYTYTLAAGQLFVNGAAYTDINQGNVGDCYFLAALGSVAQKDASAIQNMFIDNGDGTYTVRFYNNGVADYVTVDKYLPTTSGGYFAFQGSFQKVSSSSSELWAALAEKAYVQMNEKGWIGQDGTNSYQGINGGWMEAVYEQILGRNANTITNSSASAVINAVLAGQMVTAGSNSSGTTYNIVASHAYIITGYNATTQTFTLYNPWGSNQPAALTWAQLSSNFSYFATAA